MTAVTTTLVSVPRPTIKDVLQDHVQKTKQAHEHALLVQERMTWAAWLNQQYEVMELRAQKRRMQITWALLGGPLPKKRTKEA